MLLFVRPYIRLSVRPSVSPVPLAQQRCMHFMAIDYVSIGPSLFTWLQRVERCASCVRSIRYVAEPPICPRLTITGGGISFRLTIPCLYCERFIFLKPLTASIQNAELKIPTTLKTKKTTTMKLHFLL